MKSGLSAGAVAGIIAGIVGVIYVSITIAAGLEPPRAQWYWIISQIVFNLIWGAIFGVLYQRFHDAIPSKGVVKGFYFGLLIWLIHGLYVSTFLLSMVPVLNAFATSWAIGGFIVRAIAYGPVLGAIYKK